MPLIRNLNLRSRSVDNGLLLTWDKLFNAHAYTLYQEGFKYLDVDTNRSIFVPNGSYQVYAKTWQNFEGDNYAVIYPNYNYSLTLNFNYNNPFNASIADSVVIAGKYTTGATKQYVAKLFTRKFDNYSSKLKVSINLEIIDFTATDYTIKFTSSIRIISYTQNKTVVTNISLPISSSTVTI